MKQSYSPVKTIYKAFRLLEILGERESMSGSEFAQELKLTRSNVYRFLATLQQLGYLEKTHDSRYRGSFKIFKLANAVLRRRNISDIAHSYMIQLAAISQENVNLGVISDGKVLYLDKIESPHYLKLDQPIGGTDPLYCTALGKTLLSGFTDLELNDFLKSSKLIPYTKKTIIDREMLVSVVREVRRRGFVTDLEELSDGVHCIAAPIHDRTNMVIAAISISGPAVHLTRRKMVALKTPLIETSIEISKKMGCEDFGKSDSI